MSMGTQICVKICMGKQIYVDTTPCIHYLNYHKRKNNSTTYLNKIIFKYSNIFENNNNWQFYQYSIKNYNHYFLNLKTNQNCLKNY